MVMKLYGMKNIFNVQRAIVPLFEAGTEKELELVHVNLFTHDNDKPNFLAKHVRISCSEILGRIGRLCTLRLRACCSR